MNDRPKEAKKKQLQGEIEAKIGFVLSVADVVMSAIKNTKIDHLSKDITDIVGSSGLRNMIAALNLEMMAGIDAACQESGWKREEAIQLFGGKVAHIVKRASEIKRK